MQPFGGLPVCCLHLLDGFFHALRCFAVGVVVGSQSTHNRANTQKSHRCRVRRQRDTDRTNTQRHGSKTCGQLGQYGQHGAASKNAGENFDFLPVLANHSGQTGQGRRSRGHRRRHKGTHACVVHRPEQLVPAVGQVADGTVQRGRASGHRASKLVVADGLQVLCDFFGVLANGGRHALEGQRHAVALLFGLDAKFLQALEFTGGRIGHGLNHLVEVFAHGAGGVAVAGQRLL